jgi:thiamine-phosphate pyrophosphorylase
VPVTDRQRSGGADGVVARAAWAARAGVHLVQVRERDLEGRALTDLVARCVAAVRGTRARVVVNERFDVALAAGAHGVHLRAGSMAAARVRGAAPPGFLIGRSVHAPEEAADPGAVDYLIFGTVFATPPSLGGLRRAWQRWRPASPRRVCRCWRWGVTPDGCVRWPPPAR